MSEEIESEVEMPIKENAEESNFASEREQEVGMAQPQSPSTESAQQPNESDMRQSSAEEELQQQAIEDAKEEKNNAGGETEAERTEMAMKSMQQQMQQFQQQVQQAQKRIVDLQQHRKSIENTIERVENASDDERVMEHLDSQMASVEVKPEDRDNFIERLNDRVEETNEQISKIQDRGEKLQRGGMKNEISLKWLNQHLDNLY